MSRNIVFKLDKTFNKHILSCMLQPKRNLHDTRCMQRFFDTRRRDEKIIYDRPIEEAKGIIPKLIQTIDLLKVEFKKLGAQLKEKFEFSPIIIYRNDEVDIVQRFSTDPKCLDDWVLTSDSDYNYGNSIAKLELTPRGTGLFSGYLDTTVPKDGTISETGFVNITTVPRQKAFYISHPYDWSNYTHLVLRVRGDGRTYMINLLQEKEVDIAFFDTYNYFLYTRGGPYWQYTRIPFSKFVFSSKGYVQDTQGPVPLWTVIKIGISLADKITGPFSLEIDYIGVEYDESHTEKHAYEQYRYERPLP